MRMKPLRVSLLALLVISPGASLFCQTSPAFKFSAPLEVSLQTTSTPVHVQYLASGDVNGDGNTDLLMNIGFKPELLLGNGKGGFTEKLVTNGPLPGIDINSLLIDVNGDGFADYISTSGGGYDDQGGCQATPGSLNVFLGDGKGSFTTGKTYPLSPSTNIAISVGDFNHDGKPDLALVSYSTDDCAPAPAQSDLVIFLSDGKGGFTSPYSIVIDSTASSLVTGDFSGDGYLDLAYTANPFNPPGPEIETLDGNGDGTFRSGPKYAPGTVRVGQIADGDLNGDKRADLVVNLGASSTAGAQPKIATLLAKVAGGFYWQSALYTQQLFPNQSYSNYQLLDLNGDGKLDLLVPFVSLNNQWTTWASAGEGTGTFQTPRIAIISQTNYGYPIAMALTSKGLPDIILFPTSANQTPKIEVLLNQSK
jgi:hypothetical protein